MYKWLLNRLTYVQTFLIICSIFLISLAPIVYFWIKIHFQQIERINAELVELQEEVLLKRLFTQVEEHRLTAYLYLSGHETYQTQLDQIGAQIRETLEEMLKLSKAQAYVMAHTNSLLHRIDPQKLIGSWRAITQNNTAMLSEEESNVLHDSIVQNLLVEFAYLTNRIYFQDIAQKENYNLAENLSLRLPFLQENLSQLTLLKVADFLGLSHTPQERLNVLIDRIKFDLTYYTQTLDAVTIRSSTSYNQETTVKWRAYAASLDDVIQLVKSNSTVTQPSPELYDKLLSLSHKSQILGSQLWEMSLLKLNDIFIGEKDIVKQELWSVLALTLLLGLVAFIIGIIATHLANVRLNQLTQATDSFTNGNLSIRVPDTFEDEIGKQAQAFNRMAQKLQEMIGFLYQLLQATTELSQGNLKARLKVSSTGEFDHVAHSFNVMAETFETTLSQLEQTIKTLTLSINEMTASSQQQEAFIEKQEVTTIEMAQAAQEIYTSSEQLADTVEQMSADASQTSQLARTGKEALHHMEAIMSHIVDSSSPIASRLSILNEKAESITTIMTTIIKVADQTNILSLNASIEAEKAGEYGRGFAVIAREIRRLADQTATATVDIEKIVTEIMQAVHSTVLEVNQFTQDLKLEIQDIRSISEHQTQVIEQVHTFTSRFEKINLGMKLQSSGAKQISQATKQLSEKAKQTTTAIRQLHQTIEDLYKAINKLTALTQFIQDPRPNEKIGPSLPTINVDLN